jgi:hypothetical protein
MFLSFTIYYVVLGIWASECPYTVPAELACVQSSRLDCSLETKMGGHKALRVGGGAAERSEARNTAVL